MPKKKETKKEMLDMDILEEELKIETSMSLEGIKLDGMRWEVKLKTFTTLPRAYYHYRLLMELNQEPYLERIEHLEEELENSLFKDEPKQRKSTDELIAEIRDSLKQRLEECEKIDFRCTVKELKYKDSNTILTVIVPDDTIEQFNRQKTRFNLYKIVLYPIYD